MHLGATATIAVAAAIPGQSASAAMRDGQLTARAITQQYLDRITRRTPLVPWRARSRTPPSCSVYSLAPTRRDGATAEAPQNLPTDYLRFLDADGLKGARIGVARKNYTGYSPASDGRYGDVRA